MNQPIAVLKRVEGDVAACLVAGLSMPRANRAQLAELAEEVAGLRMERLAVELRRLAGEQEPAALANAALTALAMSRKLRERLAAWPQVEAGPTLGLVGNPVVKLGLTEEVADSPDVEALGHWLETGDELLRAHAVSLLLERGEESLPELRRLASKGTLTVRREAIAALGRLGSEESLGTLVSLLGDEDCWRDLLLAIRPFGQAATPLLVEALRAKHSKKGSDKSRSMAAALLYRLEEYGRLREWREDDDPVVCGFALAALARMGGQVAVKRDDDERHKLTPAIVAMAGAEMAGNPGKMIEVIAEMSVIEAEACGRWLCGGPLAPAMADHYVECLTGGTAKDRQRAARVLRGLADPAIVPRLASALRAGETYPADDLIATVGHIGGSQAVGVLVGLVADGSAVGEDWRSTNAAFTALGHLGDPGIVPILLDLLGGEGPSQTGTIDQARKAGAEAALVALGDSAVDALAREMQAGRDSRLAMAVQIVLKQVNTVKARKVLETVGVDSVDVLISQLGHPKLGSGAVKALAKQGESVLDRLEAVLTAGPPRGRLDALGAVGLIGGPRGQEIVERAIRATMHVRNYGVEAQLCSYGVELLSKHQDPRTLSLLVQLLTGAPPQARERSVAALVKLGEEVIPSVAPLLDHADATTRSLAIKVLGQLQAAQYEGRAIVLLGDPNDQVRREAAAALGEMARVTRNSRAVEALGQALLRETTWAVHHIIISLGRTGDRAAIPYLRQFAQGAPSNIGGFNSRHYVELARKQIERIEAESPGKGLFGKLRGVIGGS